MAKLGGEWYDPNAAVPVPVSEARRLFLWRVWEIAPEVAESLRQMVYPALVAVAETAELEDDLRKWDITYCTKDLEERLERAQETIEKGGATPARQLIAERLRRLSDLKSALVAWGKRWHLLDHWCLQTGLNTVLWWHVIWSKAPDAKPINFSSAATTTVWTPPNELLFRTVWSPYWKTEEDFRRYAREQFEKELDAYIKLVDDEAKAAGMVRAPRKRARSGTSTLHFDWLVRFQVQEWSHGKIGDRYFVEAKTVADACRKTADLIGLTRRTMQESPE